MDSTKPGTQEQVTATLARLLPELAVALYDSAPHHAAAGRSLEAHGLTGRQMEAVVFLAHRDAVTMGEFADGLEISRAAASELAARLVEKGVAAREADDADRRVVRVRLAGDAQALATDTLARWRAQVSAVFARYPDIDPGTLVAFLGALIDELKGRTSR
jgi:DNA-binding MarR family transcriptional regulator